MAFGSSYPSKCNGCPNLKKRKKYEEVTNQNRRYDWDPYTVKKDRGYEYYCSTVICTRDGSKSSSSSSRSAASSSSGGCLWPIIKWGVIITIIISILHSTPLWDVLKTFLPFLA